MKTFKVNYFSRSMLLLALTLFVGCKNPETGDKSAPQDSKSQKVAQDDKVVLVVLSSKNELEMDNKTTIKTGYFLDELAVPAQAMIAAGYRIEVATPNGIAPTMDASSDNKSFFKDNVASYKKALEFAQTYPGLQQPLKLSDVAASDLKKYSAVFIPGGRAPMTDLMQNGDLGKILRFAHQEKIITALLCHGPVALTAALDDAPAYRKALVAKDKTEVARLGRNWIYAGYQMTIFSNAEEDDALKDSAAKLQFYVADALANSGGITKHGSENWKPFIVRDRELITGQNPASDHALAAALLDALAKNK